MIDIHLLFKKKKYAEITYNYICYFLYLFKIEIEFFLFIEIRLKLK